MIPVEPPEREDADIVQVLEAMDGCYVTVPASIDACGVALIEYELTEDELALLVHGGRIRIWQHTYGNGPQPLRVEVTANVEPIKES